MPIQESLYRAGLRALRGVSPLLSVGDSKLARGVRGRRDAARSLIRWARTGRDPERPVVWFHAPSVGEGFQARAVAESMLDLRPELQVVHTYFSPSAERFDLGMPAAVSGYLPWDLPEELGPVLEAVRPALVACTKTEVWPVLSAEAVGREVPLVLVGASLPRTAGRLRWPARRLLRPTFRRLRRVAAISDEDAAAFPELGVPEERIVVTGDPGIDSAAGRADAVDPEAPHLRPFRSEARTTLVAGSTWPADEDVLIPALSRARRAESGLRVVVAPHEPEAHRIAALESELRTRGWTVARLQAVEDAGTAEGVDAVVVDRVGVLADLYTVGDAAYVGGGFHDEGLHSVLEPAAAGSPVLFGPRHDNARAARELLEAGGAERVSSADDLAAALEAWIRHPDRRRRAGERAAGWLDEHRGAAGRTARLLLEVAGLEPEDPPTHEPRPG